MIQLRLLLCLFATLASHCVSTRATRSRITLPSAEDLFDYDGKCMDETMYVFLNVPCTLGTLFGRANVTFNALRNITAAAHEAFPVVGAGRGKKAMEEYVTSTDAVLDEINECVDGIHSRIFKQDSRDSTDSNMTKLLQKFEECKSGVENSTRGPYGAPNENDVGTVRDLVQRREELLKYWNETYEEAVQARNGTETLNNLVKEGCRNKCCKSENKCGQGFYWSVFSKQIDRVYGECGNVENTFDSFNSNVTQFVGQAVAGVTKAHDAAAKLKAHREEMEAMRRGRECVPLFKQLLDLLPAWR
ncbi:hypothetical protein ERJ75_001578300 [Trypanosoma vivax]|nr:hypothetical protein ERJ75_001578300 [Trypanosoma vivax]